MKRIGKENNEASKNWLDQIRFNDGRVYSVNHLWVWASSGNRIK